MSEIGAWDPVIGEGCEVDFVVFFQGDESKRSRAVESGVAGISLHLHLPCVLASPSSLSRPVHLVVSASTLPRRSSTVSSKRLWADAASRRRPSRSLFRIEDRGLRIEDQSNKWFRL